MTPHLPPIEPAPPPSRPEGGCATVILAVLGVILLLPGICSIIFGLSMASGGMLTWRDVPSLLPFVVIIGGLFALGIWLIRRLLR